VVYLENHIGIGCGWPWSATSGMMFRRGVIDMIMPADGGDMRINADQYLCYVAHAIGGLVIIRSAPGGYSQHGENNFSSNPLIGRVPVNPVHKRTPSETIQKLALGHLEANRHRWTEMLGPVLFDQILLKLAYSPPPPVGSPEPGTASINAPPVE